MGLPCGRGFTPPRRKRGLQGLLTKLSGQSGYGLFIAEDGSLALWIGDGTRLEKVSTGVALHTAQWHCIAASYDAATGAVCLYQELQSNWPVPRARAQVCKTISPLIVGENEEDLLMAAAAGPVAPTTSMARSTIRGSTDRALSVAEADADTPIANWDFSLDIGAEIVRDTGANQLHGRTVNLPTRAVTGHNWTGDESDFKVAPSQYGAIHFHDDDLEDAQWDVSFEWTVPSDWPSGVYAAHLTTRLSGSAELTTRLSSPKSVEASPKSSADAEDYLPFIVVPQRPRPASPSSHLPSRTWSMPTSALTIRSAPCWICAKAATPLRKTSTCRTSGS